jgi:CRP-like cAMP-binding protein
MASEAPIAVQNGMLSSLPKAVIDSIDLEFVRLRQRQVLYRSNEPITHLDFIESGIVSLVTILSDGGTSEGAIIGTEGVVGFRPLLGWDSAEQHAIVQFSGSAWRMTVETGARLFFEVPEFRAAILRFAGYVVSLAIQNAACNRLHSAVQRLARRLLMLSERVPGALELTQEYLAAMLGVRRTGVTQVAQSLRRSGLIEYRHGLITILDRKGLETAACECYHHDRQYFHLLVGADRCARNRMVTAVPIR